ncbi:helix-turn-helix domain-containing protein [Geodermatophilus sp. URMC 64]
MRDELQELVDQVSRLLAAPVTLEDAEFTLLAFCAHDGAGGTGMDAVRTRSILTRGSPPETRRWFEEFGIARAEGPLRTPADPGAGILTRLVIPVRHAGRTHGYLWLLDEGRTDPDDADDAALAAAVELAAEAGRLLAGREPAEGALDRVLRTALTGGGTARDRAFRTLGDRFGAGAAQLVVALAPAGGVLPSGWRAPGAGAVSAVLAEDGERVAVLVPLRRAGDLRPATALTAAALSTLPPGSSAGLSAVRSGIGDLPGQWAEARAAARVAAGVEEFAPVAHWAELGAWRAITALPGPDPAVGRLLAEPVLARTAEVFLDCAGSASRAAAALGIHRQTLYYRLGRVSELTGLDLADGADRLLVHTALKAGRLDRTCSGR